MPEDVFLQTTLPLFEAGVVDTVEWSFDMSWRAGLPPWLDGLLTDYSSQGLLSGHGVSLSPLSQHPRQDQWHDRFAVDVDRFAMTQVSEHFGFMAAGAFHRGPPMPIAFSPESVAIGQAHLSRLRAVSNCPVGLENLALAFSKQDVFDQGRFLHALLEPTDGFVVLDVHNLWCQAHNFDVDPADILATYPTDRVTECHISGGSWSVAGDRTIRRDTHDGDIPDQAFDLLELAIRACPNVHSVIVERIGHTLSDPSDQHQFRHDYNRVRDLVHAKRDRS